MWIHSLEGKNFRNYSSLSIEFDKGTNLLYGDNAQGKTNILEGIYMGATTRSHKGSKDKDMIKFGEEEAHLRIQLFKKEIPHKIDIHLRKNKKKGAAIDGFPIRKASELFGFWNVIMFAPEDLFIVKNGPAGRRRFMDVELCKLDPVYMDDISKYNKVLEQRNSLLKTAAAKPAMLDTLDIWDEQLVEYGKRIISRRRKFIDNLTGIMQPIHSKISGGSEDALLIYEPNSDEDSLMEKIRQNRERDRFTFQTNAGPHRDDFSIKANGIDLRTFGSQGQQRSAAISLKIAEIDLTEKAAGEKPVLLLDDVLSELDDHRQEYLLNAITGLQTIMTGTGIDDVIKNNLKIERKFLIHNGNVEGD